MALNSTPLVHVALALALSGAGHAYADDPAALATTEVSGTARPANPAERPFLYSVDPSLPAPGQVVVSAGLGNVTRTGQERPVGAGQLVPTVGAEVGLLSRLSLYAEAGAAFASQGATIPSPVTLQAGAHVLLTDPASRHVRVALQAGYGLDFRAASSLALTTVCAVDYARVRAVASLTATHTFRGDADPIDLGGSLGVSAKLPAGFLAGAEAVTTDLEELDAQGAEGGPSSFVGPTVGWEWGHRLQVVAGPAFGRAAGMTGTSVLARAAASLQF